MNETHFPSTSEAGGGAPVTEADLHAYIDRQLSPTRRAEVEMFLSLRPDDLGRVRDWQRQNNALREALAPILDEPLPLRLSLRGDAANWPWRSLAAGTLVALVSAGAAWTARGALDETPLRQARAAALSPATELEGFAQRAAVAHAVYSPDPRRPVEVGAGQEQALVTWLTRRIGAAVHPPGLSSVGYELIGGRLLPGGKGPVAQFMYGASGGERLTLYVARQTTGQDTSFRFVSEGGINTFYWVEDRFAYAISAGADRETLLRVSQEVYRQLKPG